MTICDIRTGAHLRDTAGQVLRGYFGSYKEEKYLKENLKILKS